VSPRDSRIDDADLVAEEYASEEAFLARRAALVDCVESPNAEDLALGAIAEAAPRSRSRHSVFVAETAR
jgi:hypothetical protein